MREQIEGYAPLHHRWCTQHLAENLLRKDGVKGNFDLFQEAARQLEDKYFKEKLERSEPHQMQKVDNGSQV